MKQKYVREHYQKVVRKKREEALSEKKERRQMESSTRTQKKQRVWTLNRSPHGNKTAREQFGRQIWQRTVVLKEKEGEKGRRERTKRIQERKTPVKRKQTERS